MQSYFQLLGKPMPGCAPFYRGTYRNGLAYDESKPEDHPVNVAFFLYVEHEEKILELESALSLYAIVREYQDLTLLLLTPEKIDRPNFIALGYDISLAGWYSFLGILPTSEQTMRSHSAEVRRLVDFCWERRNSFGLLDQRTDALYVRDDVCRIAKQINFFESPEYLDAMEPMHLSVYGI